MGSKLVPRSGSNDPKIKGVNMSKHAPGSWWFAATEECDYYVAGAGDKELTNLISLEDARLIASAPDLLCAMRMLLSDIEDYQRVNKLGGINNHCQVAARAAIAKATGEET